MKPIQAYIFSSILTYAGATYADDLGSFSLGAFVVGFVLIVVHFSHATIKKPKTEDEI